VYRDNQTSFVSGEISPRLLSRTDAQQYRQGAKSIINAYPTIQGSLKRRPGTLFVQAAKNSGTKKARLMPFVLSATQAYILEWGDLYVRIFAIDGVYTGVELVSPYTENQVETLDYTQSGDTLYVFHPQVTPQRLKFFGATAWELVPIPYVTAPFDETGFAPATSLTLSATSGAITVTAAAAAFLPCDVGRNIVRTDAKGIATITGYTSTTVVTAQVITTFSSTSIASGNWYMDVSPQAFIKASAQTPAGTAVTVAASQTRGATLTLTAKTGAITINASAAVFVAGDTGKIIYADAGQAGLTFVNATQCTAVTTSDFTSLTLVAGSWGITQDAWRSTDVGSFLRFNGGMVKITSLLSASVVNGIIYTVPTGVTTTSVLVAAPPLSWTLEAPAFSTSLGFPTTGTFYEQRLLMAGTTRFPQTIWASRLGNPLDFTKGVLDSDSWEYTISSEETNQITFLQPFRGLLVYTFGGEYSLQAPPGRTITPTSPPSIRRESRHGTRTVRPIFVGTQAVFVQRSGLRIRSMDYQSDANYGDRYRGDDLTAIAEHITASGVAGLIYQNEPDQLIWAWLNDGSFISCTIDPDAKTVLAFSHHYTDGFVECMAVIPQGTYDQVWLLVRRYVNGVSVRYVERFDHTFAPDYPVAVNPNASPPTVAPDVYGTVVDCGVTVDNGSGQSSFTGLGALEAKTVAVIADGVSMGNFTIATAVLTPPLSRTSKRTMIGIPFNVPPQVTLLTPEFQTQAGTAQGTAMKTGRIYISLLKSLGCTVLDREARLQTIPFTDFGPGKLDIRVPMFTGIKLASVNGWNIGKNEITIAQYESMPWHVLAVVREVQAN
jgi:hypothetical protein